MKLQSLLYPVVLIMLVSTYGYGQRKVTSNNNEALVKAYALEANRLDLQTNPDSITKAYGLHTKILELNSRVPASYRAKICIDYKRNELREALKTATDFTTNLPEEGDSWVYLGIVQLKLKDSINTVTSFEKAITIYNSNLNKRKEQSQQTGLKFKKAIVQNFLGHPVEPIIAENRQKKNETTTITVFIEEASTVEQYVNKFMNFNSLQFF